MRVMEIPRSPRKITESELDDVMRSRLSRTEVVLPEQAISLAGYMGWPNDPLAREAAVCVLRDSLDGSRILPPGLPRIQIGWARVADVLHKYCDLLDGKHQARRGGPSLGKAITLVEADAKSRGTGAASLWLYWGKYKDVAHLVTAAAFTASDAIARSGGRPFGPSGLSVKQFSPFQMVMVMPDVVLAVALEFERRGLGSPEFSHAQPALDHKTLWCIPPKINLEPLTLPRRRLIRYELEVLNERRAGNRGKANKKKNGTPGSVTDKTVGHGKLEL